MHKEVLKKRIDEENFLLQTGQFGFTLHISTETIRKVILGLAEQLRHSATHQVLRLVEQLQHEEINGRYSPRRIQDLR